MASTALVGHGVSLGRLVVDGARRAGPDEDAVTLAIEAADAALGRAGRAPVDRVLLVIPPTTPDEIAVVLAGLRLADDTPVLRPGGEADAVAFAQELPGRSLIAASDGTNGVAVVVAAEGYAELSPVRRDQTGAAIRDPRRDPHFTSAAGGRALAGRLGGKTVSPSPLLDAVRALENGGKATVVGGGDGAAAAFDVSLTGALPAGPTLAAWEATGRAPSKAEARGAGGPRPRGATGVDPDGALLWRERRELLAPLGAQCASCARVNVPPSGAVLCRRCGGRELSVVELPRQGVVISYATAPRSLPRALPAPSTTIYAELTGGTWWKALGTGYAGGDIAVRDPVELVVRRIALDDGAPIYGLAFRKPLA